MGGVLLLFGYPFPFLVLFGLKWLSTGDFGDPENWVFLFLGLVVPLTMVTLLPGPLALALLFIAGGPFALEPGELSIWLVASVVPLTAAGYALIAAAKARSPWLGLLGVWSLLATSRPEEVPLT